MSERGLMRLRLPAPPSVNAYWRMGHGHIHISNVGRAYKQTVAVMARNQLGVYAPLSGEVSVVITWWRKHRRGDTDNTLKALLDSLKGICYKDDSQIASILIARVNRPEEESAVTVSVEQMP